jgi:hypothetical protein
MVQLTENFMPDLRQVVPRVTLAHRRESYGKGFVAHVNRFCPPNVSCSAASSLRRREHNSRRNEHGSAADYSR